MNWRVLVICRQSVNSQNLRQNTYYYIIHNDMNLVGTTYMLTMFNCIRTPYIMLKMLSLDNKNIDNVFNHRSI